MAGPLYVIEQSDYSGAEVLHLPVMRADPDALLACPPDSRTEAWAREAGIATVALRQRRMRHSGGALETVRSLGRGLAGARELRRLLKAHPERTVIYGIAFRSSLLAAVAALGLGRRVVWYVSDFPPPPPVGWLVKLIAVLGCHRALAVSRTAAGLFAGRLGVLQRRTRVVYPGVELDRFSPDDTDRDPFRAAILGHVSPTKRTDLAVEIARIVAAQEPRFTLDVIGRAQFRDEDFALERRLTEQVASDPLLARHVTFRGYVKEPARELSRYGLLLHCRPDEPFGMVVVEAQAAGMVVVVPGKDGPAEIVRDGETGLTYPPDDAQAAADAVLRVLGDPALRRRLRAAALDDVATRFTAAGQVAAIQRELAALAASS